MLTPPTTGNLRQYLTQPEKWRDFDSELFGQLVQILDSDVPSRHGTIESCGIIPRALFFNTLLTDRTDRSSYFSAALSHLEEADLVFFDPDNGIAPSRTPKTRRGSSQFIHLDEIADAYDRRHSVLIYQHFPRVPRDQFIDKLGAELARASAGALLWCLRTPFAAFLLLIHPYHEARLTPAAKSIPEHWKPRFIDGKQLVQVDG